MIYMIYVHATCHACVTRGPHASCHVASVPRRNGAVDPRAKWARSPRQLRLGLLATSAPPGPTRHIITCGKPTPFFDFLIKKGFKIYLKIK